MMLRTLLMLVGIVPSSLAEDACLNLADPIIDVHIHAYAKDSRLSGRVPNPFSGVPSSATDGQSHRNLTVQAIEDAGIVRAIVSGESLSASKAMVAADPIRLRLGFEVDAVPGPEDLERIRQLHAAGELTLIGEIAPQYVGVAPNDPRMEPFWSLAEDLQLPVGYHMASGPRDIVYSAFPDHRAALGNPLLIEEVLVRHPKLKLFIMHGGFPFADAMQALMSAYPRVYLDLGAIHFYEARTAFHAYLRRMIEAGFGERIMFGSDQMTWPEAIAQSISAYKEADYLSEKERRDIFFNNAVRFFEWNDLAGCTIEE